MLGALTETPANSLVIADRIWAMAAREHPDYADVERRAAARRWDKRWDQDLIDQARTADERQLAREVLTREGTLKDPRDGFDNYDVVRVGNQLLREGLVVKTGPSRMHPRRWALA